MLEAVIAHAGYSLSVAGQERLSDAACRRLAGATPASADREQRCLVRNGPCRTVSDAARSMFAGFAGSVKFFPSGLPAWQAATRAGSAWRDLVSRMRPSPSPRPADHRRA